MAQVWWLDLTHSKRMMLLALADHAHDDGTQCYPGVRYLAWKTGYSERQVRRILASLEANGLIAAQGEKLGGRGHATEYHLHFEKGSKKSPYRPKKGDTTTLFGNENGDIREAKGDISNANPDIAMSPQPSRETSDEPSVGDGELTPLPDDVTGSCLLLLRKVIGFPRDEAKVACVLAELREQHPYADPIKVCEDYEWKHRYGGMKTTKHLSRLRAFFASAQKRAEQDRGKVTSLSGGRSRAVTPVAPVAGEYAEAAY